MNRDTLIGPQGTPQIAIALLTAVPASLVLWGALIALVVRL